MATAAGAGALAALAWFVVVLIRPPVPTDPAGALRLVLAAGSLAAAATTGHTRRRLAAALCAGTGAALLIVVLANSLLQLLSHWVPDTRHAAPPGISAVQRLSANETRPRTPTSECCSSASYWRWR